MIVAMGSFGTARLYPEEVNKALRMLESKERDLVRLLILPWKGA